MKRRQFTAAMVAAPFGIPVLTRVGLIPPVEFGAEDWAAAGYLAGADAEIRSVSVRVSRWAEEDAAERHRERSIDGAGSVLPEGEFYQTEPVRSELPPELSALPATAMAWSTTVGVAAYHTEWVILAARRATLVWDLRVGGGEAWPVRDVTVALAHDLTSRESPTGASLFHLLPGADDVPDGLRLDYRMTPDGTFNAEGMPVPEPAGTAVPDP